jgi:hypothetical protein
MWRKLSVAVLAGAVILSASTPAQALVTPQSDAAALRPAARESLQTRQYRLSERLAGTQASIQQSITVWEVTGGTWNGQSLQGLSLVVVRRTSDGGSCAPTTDCYISHRASLIQQNALLDAFVSSQSRTPDDSASWHLEPADIRLEHAGSLVIVHLGRVA